MVESLFRGAVQALGGRSGSEISCAYAALEKAYRTVPRAYHSLRHVEKVLETFLSIEEDLSPMESARATLALIYHDAVYDPRRSDNEAQSAALARGALGSLGVEEADLAEIERLVLATKDHVPSDGLSTFVIDADLAILAAPPAEYDAYAAAIRQEYAHLPDAEYRTGRRRVLESLLSKRLFTSPLLDEAAARTNIGREVERLSR